MPTPRHITLYTDFVKHHSWRWHWRSPVRNGVVFLLSLAATRSTRRGAIRFTCYHHLFDDERTAFARQLRCMRNYGEFIPLEEAVAMLRTQTPIDGQYVCMTFDDGYKNCLSNALPILLDHGCKATFFIVSELADAASCSLSDPDAVAAPHPAELMQRVLGFVCPEGESVEFLSWEECRLLQQEGMTIAPHTRSHRNLALLSANESRQEMVGSREDIHRHLGRFVPHLACPIGRPGLHFRPDVEPFLAQEAGFHSFFTLERGPNCLGTNPFRIKREHLCAGWGDYQIKYFFSRSCPGPPV
ncbi:MAG: polysaccharide deacetylase family protein [Magnetococcus sp. MYC-9]